MHEIAMKHLLYVITTPSCICQCIIMRQMHIYYEAHPFVMGFFPLKKLFCMLYLLLDVFSMVTDF